MVSAYVIKSSGSTVGFLPVTYSSFGMFRGLGLGGGEGVSVVGTVQRLVIKFVHPRPAEQPLGRTQINTASSQPCVV